MFWYFIFAKESKTRMIFQITQGSCSCLRQFIQHEPYQIICVQGDHPHNGNFVFIFQGGSHALQQFN